MTLAQITDIDTGKTIQINKDQIQYVIALEDGTSIIGMFGIKFHIQGTI